MKTVTIAQGRNQGTFNLIDPEPLLVAKDPAMQPLADKMGRMIEDQIVHQWLSPSCQCPSCREARASL